jgi:hypothetical protein
MATIQADILRRSVTRDEVEQATTHRYWFHALGDGTSMVSMAYEPPPYWSSERDAALRSVYRRGGLWASAVNIAVTRMMVAGYELDGDIALRVRRAREMLGAGWIDLLTKVGADYCTTDNGGFVEVVRASKAYASRVLGFVRLSSLRCIRTGDPETPVIYTDRLGRYHELRAHQVAEFSDMPDEDFYDVGLSATSRAWDYIYEHRAVSAYFKEKATGRRPLELVFMSGIGDAGIAQAISSAQEDADRQGKRSYMGVAVTGNPNNVPLQVARIPLASLPDGFNQQTHDEITQIRFAAILGIDPSDLNPRLIGNRALGAGSQAQVLDEKQDSKGLIALRQKFIQFLNDTERWHALPGGVTFAWSERDLRDQKAKADISQVRAATRAAQVASAEITPAEARQLAVDAGDIPENFIAQDQTTEETLTDEDKADQGIAETPVSAPDISVDIPAPAPNDAITLQEFLREDVRPKAVAALKAASTELVALSPAPRRGRVRDGYWREVTKELSEYGRLLTIALRQHMPQDTGDMARSVRFQVTQKDTSAATLKVFAGNTERPEVAVRSVLYGRRGFGPKRAKALRFQVGGKTIFARKVRGALSQDFMEKAWSQTAPQRDAMEERLARSMSVEMIDVGDVPGAIKRTRQDQIRAPKTSKRRKK